MIKVLVVSPFSKDANSLHRCMGPWNYLTRHARDEVSISLAQDDLGHSGIAWDCVDQFDMVFMHRPCREDDLIIMKICKNIGIPVWIDYDDYLFEVPYWNPHAHVYANNSMHNIMATLIACADLISVTTSALYDRLRLVNDNVVIVPNAYRSDLYSYREAKTPERNTVFSWRGTNTHDADVLSVTDGFRSLPAKTHFYGSPPWLLMHQMPYGSFQVIGSQDPFTYMRQIYSDSPRVMLVPLVDCFFNRVKSNIAYQEALHAGALCVAPELPEWKRPGVITYIPGDSASFLDAAHKAFSMDDVEHQEVVSSAYEHMKEMYDITIINDLRMAILRGILAKDFKKNERNIFDPLLGAWALGVIKRKPSEAVYREILQEGVTS